MSSLWKPFVSSVVDNSRSVMSVLCNFSCNISHMLLLTGFKSGEFWGHSWGGINSGVSLYNNSTVACAQWAFEVSRGSIETLFRRGGKRLHHFWANLFRKRYTKCHQNRPSVVGDITKNVLISCFSWTPCSIWQSYDIKLGMRLGEIWCILITMCADYCKRRCPREHKYCISVKKTIYSFYCVWIWPAKWEVASL